MMNPETQALLNRVLAMPHTHKVVTTYADGRVREFTTRSLETAEQHSILDRRNIGRVLKVRDEPGKTVMIVKVEVKAI